MKPIFLWKWHKFKLFFSFYKLFIIIKGTFDVSKYSTFYNLLHLITCFCILATKNKVAGKSREEHMREKKQELEKRLQDVSGQLGQPTKKSTKKGLYCIIFFSMTMKCL